MSAPRPPVVMIHGAFCGGWAFDNWRGVFEARGYRVHAPTLRHHDHDAGPSAELGRTSLVDYIADLEALIERIGEPAVVIGHSMGGLLAQMLAARGRASALILLAPAAPWGVMPSSTFEIASAQSLYLAGDFWHRPLAPSHRIAAAHTLDRLAPTARDEILPRLVPESGRALFEMLHWFFDLKRTSEVEPRAVACPLLCFSGSHDRIAPPLTVRRIARRYCGRAQVHALEGFGHWPLAEPGWEKVARHALFWLDRINASADARLKH